MAEPRTAMHRDWAALPACVLQHIFGWCAPTCYTPGSCLAAPVCHAWRSAAAGCSGICLLYHAGFKPSDRSLATWLGRSAQQLGAFTLNLGFGSGFYGDKVLEALAEAAAAAQAAGQPLKLHTLRVLGDYVDVQVVGRLLSRLPNLRCTQLAIKHNSTEFHYDPVKSAAAANALWQEHLAPLRQAVQLEELYIAGPGSYPSTSFNVDAAALLPPSLRRLSWGLPSGTKATNLSHLTQLAFCQLCDWAAKPAANGLPPALNELQLLGVSVNEELLMEQQQAVTRWQLFQLGSEATQRRIAGLPNLTAVDVALFDLQRPAACKALVQLGQLSALTVRHLLYPGISEAGVALTAAGALSNLQRLHLDMPLVSLPAASGLSGVTQVTQLVLRVNCDSTALSSKLAAEVGALTGLKWLSVRDVLLSVQQPWLGNLQQLRVLALGCSAGDAAKGSGMYADSLPWLEACSLQAPLPSLRVVCWGGVPAEQAAAWQLRRRLRQLVGGNGCEVVVGPDLHKVADPTQQLAGLPPALQQALM